MSAPSTSLTDPRWRVDEMTTLTEFLDFYRAVVRRKAEGLSAEQLARSLPPATMTLGGMLKHLAYVEHWWFGSRLLGQEPVPPWDAVDWDADEDWDWHSAADDEPDALFRLYDASIARSQEIVGRVEVEDGAAVLDRLSVHAGRREGSGHFSLRWILVHMIEEYARHAGHADLIRESIDGTTGD